MNMSIRVLFANGLFKLVENADNIPDGAVYTVLSEDELRRRIVERRHTALRTVSKISNSPGTGLTNPKD